MDGWMKYDPDMRFLRFSENSIGITEEETRVIQK